MATHQILDSFVEIVSQFQAVPGNQINLEQLNNTEKKLQDILFQLEFELASAQAQRNWEEINKFESAVGECKLTLDKVTATIINFSIIGINPENLIQMQKILEEINTARKTQVNIDLAIKLLSLLRRLFV